MTATTQALISRRSAIRWLAWLLAAGGSAKQVFAQTRLSNTTSASDGDALLGLNWLNRITWGSTVSSLKQLTEQGMAAYLKNQLKGGSYSLPAQAQAQIDAMSISQQPMFTASLGKKFCDPLHYVLAALRASNDERVILNPGPIMGWLQRLGEPLFSHLTPYGYPLEPSNWLNVGQMATRFDIAKSIAPNNPNLWRTDMQKPPEPAPPTQFFKTL